MKCPSCESTRVTTVPRYSRVYNRQQTEVHCAACSTTTLLDQEYPAAPLAFTQGMRVSMALGAMSGVEIENRSGADLLYSVERRGGVLHVVLMEYTPA